MPLQKLQFRPGVNREGTTLSNEGGWFESDKVRFRSGYPEKIGGWELDLGTDYATTPIGTFVTNGVVNADIPPAGVFWGICRSMWNWLNLAGFNLLGVGTNLKYYLQNDTNGYFYDITPIRTTTGAGEVTFARFAIGSPIITVTDAGHGAQVGDFVIFSGAAGLGGAITAGVLNAEFQVTNYISSNQYQITASVAATIADSGDGGASTIGHYQINGGNEIFTQNVGWGAGTWGGVILGATTTEVAGGTLSNSNTTVTVTSTTGFTPTGNILIESETISYTGITPTTFTGCTRGVGGAGSGAAASHANGVAVVQSTTYTGWGVAASTSTVYQQLRLWSQSNFGQDLILAPRGGSMYYWANNATPTSFDRAQLLGPGATVQLSYSATTFTPDSSCPSIVNLVTVSDSSRFVLAFGCNDYPGTVGANIQNPMLVRWSDQENPAVWAPAITNQAGSYTLSHGSQIVTAIQTRQEILVLTDSAIYSMQYLGPPYVWGFQLMGDNISLAGPNAISTVNNVTYWMGTDKFYMYSGRVETLPCALRQYVFENINLTQSYQFFAGTNEGYNEIWWYYCSVTGTNPDGSQGSGTPSNPNEEIDRYVIFNHLERTWYYGSMPRTYWLDSPLRATPMATGYNGKLIYHEQGNDDGATTPGSYLPITAYVQSSDFDIGDGHNFGLVTRIIPDVTFDGSTTAAPSLDFAVRPRQFPGTNYGTADAPTVTSGNNYGDQRYYNVQQFTEQVFVRIRGRQMALKIISNDLGVAWQLGVPRIDARPDGRR